jgi:tumor protein p53-inducible protein 3
MKHYSGIIIVSNSVQSSTVTATDCEIRRGEWADVRLSPYIIPGSTFVGKIDDSEKKSAFSSFKPGDIVMSLVKAGSNARYMCIPKNAIVKVPPHVDSDLAACLPEIYLTAFQVLHMNHRYGSIRYRGDALKGQSILVMNGHSTLGRAIIELSLAAGAAFCYALVKPRQADAVSRLGGIPLSKDPQDWLTLIGRQIHLLVTVIDGSSMCTDNVTKEHLKALNKDGEVVIVGQRGVDNSNNIVSNQPSKPGSRLICKAHKIQDRTKSYNVFDRWESDTKQCKHDLEHLVKLLEDGRVQPEILERIPLSKIAKAQAIVETKKLSGHIVCKPWLPQTYVPN